MAEETRLVLRQDHRAGEKMFVDYAGATIPIYDPASGAVNPAAVFVAVLGASSYTFAEAPPGRICGTGPARICASSSFLVA